MIIIYAYDLRDFQFAGGPAWVGDDRYDIVAKAASAGRVAFETKDCCLIDLASVCMWNRESGRFWRFESRMAAQN